MKALLVGLGAALGVAALVAYSEVNHLPKGGTITFEDPQHPGEFVTYVPDQSWTYSRWEQFKTWLFGRLPGGSAKDET